MNVEQHWEPIKGDKKLHENRSALEELNVSDREPTQGRERRYAQQGYNQSDDPAAHQSDE